MAKHRIRQWLQFGILDLLIVTTIVAVGVVLWRPQRIETYYEPLAEGTTPGQHWAGNGLLMKFRWCPAAEFKMGEDKEIVEVRLTRGFWLGKYEVTQDEYRQVMNDSPSFFPQGRSAAMPAGVDPDKLPVEGVSWDNAVEFCRLLTEQEREAGRLPPRWEYGLPTEAQWEYACRAGTQTPYSFGDESRLGDFAWFFDNSELRTHEVGQKLPNAWGLRDMHGNVWEWWSDRYQDTLVMGGTDQKITERASDRVFRGGGSPANSWSCRSAHRGRGTPDYRSSVLGFRVALVPLR